MKKGQLLNAALSHQLALLGHTDTFAIGDAGLPIPQEVKRIDLALAPNLPGFLQTLKVVLNEMVIEKVTLANEIKERNPQLHKEIIALMVKENIPIEYCDHKDFKEELPKTRFIIRTGEFSFYANIILHAGVNF